MERRNLKAILIAGGLLSLSSALFAEKIQFSTPSSESSALAPEKRDLPKSSPNLFDKFRSGGPEALNMPMPAAPQYRVREKNDGKKSLFGSPEDSLSSDNLFQKRDENGKESNSRGLARAMEQVERNEALLRGSAQNNQANESYAESYGTRNEQNDYRSGLSNPKFDLSRDRFQNEGLSLNEYWKETTGMDPDRFAEQTALRRTEFQQIFDSQAVLQDKSLPNTLVQPQKNLLAPAPTDFSSRTSQSSFSDSYQAGYNPMTGTKASVLDDVNARALGREASSPLNTRIEQPRVQAQPAVLPFPTRPGEIFKRPGSF